jgi:hypothetical protein
VCFVDHRFDAVKRDREDMHEYQDTAVDFMDDNPFSALFIDTGLGKTVISLTLIDRLLTTTFLTRKLKILVVAPIRVAAQTWPTELAEWRHTCVWEYSLIRAEDDDPEVVAAGKAASAAKRDDPATAEEARQRGREAWYWATTGEESRNACIDVQFRRLVASAGQKARTAKKEELRRRAAASDAPIHIIDREHLEWLVDLHSKVVFVGPRKLKKWKVLSWPYAVIFIDESSAFKDYTTGRFKALNAVRGHIERMHQLTATPASETYLHLFPQIYLLDRGQRLGRTITSYRMKYFFNPPKSRFKWLLNKGADELIAKQIGDITLVMKSKDYLEEEDPLFLERKLRMETWQQDIYDGFLHDFVMRLPDDTVIEAANPGDHLGKLLQLSSGAVYKPNDRDYINLHDHKIEDVKQLAEELEVSGNPLMIAYWYRHSLARLKKAFPKAVVMDKKGACVPKWNKGEIPILLVHPASVGHGLNMQYGPGHDIYFFDLPWSYELYYQLYRRLHRQGQTQQVRVHIPQMIGTATRPWPNV